MNIVLFEESEINLPLSIKDNRGKHITQILHKKEGEFFDAGIIGGKAGKAKITSAITIFQNGKGNFAREMRVAGISPEGKIGFYKNSNSH